MSTEAFSTSGPDLVDRLERVIEREIAQTEPTLRLVDLLLSYGNEQYEFAATPASRIAYIISLLDVSGTDVIFDLGSGYGSVPIIGSFFCEAAFVGIELVRERHLAATRLRDRFQLHNIDFVNAHVLAADLSRGNKFYMFSPFFHSTLREICAKLKNIAKTKPLTIVSVSQNALVLGNLDWLEKLSTPVVTKQTSAFDFNICLFQSRS